VVDRYETPFHEVVDTHGETCGVIECTWCGATFDSDLVSWVEHRPSPWMSVHRQVFTDGKRMLEVLGFCDDGHPFVRERSGAKVEHCRRQLAALRN
jgi:hypothetical protein